MEATVARLEGAGADRAGRSWSHNGPISRPVLTMVAWSWHSTIRRGATL